MWRNDIDPVGVVLGLGFYGRSFTLKDPGCSKPGCPFLRTDDFNSGGAKPGDCTGTSGILSSYEINRLIKAKSLKPEYDKEAGVRWIAWDKDQWRVSKKFSNVYVNDG